MYFKKIILILTVCLGLLLVLEAWFRVENFILSNTLFNLDKVQTATTNIVTIGDSIGGTYPSLLERQLNDAGYKTRVYPFISYNSTLKQYLNSLVKASRDFQPTVTLMMIGLHDFGGVRKMRIEPKDNPIFSFLDHHSFLFRKSIQTLSARGVYTKKFQASTYGDMHTTYTAQNKVMKLLAQSKLKEAFEFMIAYDQPEENTVMASLYEVLLNYFHNRTVTPETEDDLRKLYLRDVTVYLNISKRAEELFSKNKLIDLHEAAESYLFHMYVATHNLRRSVANYRILQKSHRLKDAYKIMDTDLKNVGHLKFYLPVRSDFMLRDSRVFSIESIVKSAKTLSEVSTHLLNLIQSTIEWAPLFENGEFTHIKKMIFDNQIPSFQKHNYYILSYILYLEGKKYNFELNKMFQIFDKYFYVKFFLNTTYNKVTDLYGQGKISEQQLNILQNNRAFQLWRATQSEQKEDRMKNYNKKLSLELIDLCNSKKFNCEKNKIILMSYPNHNTDGFLIDRLTATGIDLIDNLEPFQTTIQSSGWSAIFKDYIGYSTGHLNETGKGKFVEKIISHLKDRSLIKKEKTPSMNSDKVR